MTRMDDEGYSIAIDPSSVHYLGNQLFNLSNAKLNRDGSLLPFYHLFSALTQQGVVVNTVDLLMQGKVVAKTHDYYSFGMLRNCEQLKGRKDIRLKGFIIMEPPVVAPELYKALPNLTENFEWVYVHNTLGKGYSLRGVDQTKLRKFYWPLPYKGALEPYWAKIDRLKRIVVINGNHKPKNYTGELYSKRIEAMAALARQNVVDLYGPGWDKWWARRSFWLPYWRNRGVLMSINRGPCTSKFETLSHYRFCLCFENMQMPGYVTEKLFDCLYAGTIPLYLGAPDISEWVPVETYIDCRKFVSWENMWDELNEMSVSQCNIMREAGRDFLSSENFLKYYNSLQDMLCPARSK